MAPMTTTSDGTQHPTSESSNGRSVTPTGALTRLNYFDGKFLRAADMRLEQDYLRQLVFTSNLGGGTGIVHGYDTTLASGDMLDVGPGLAIDRQGRVLLLANGLSITIGTLLGGSSATGAVATVTAGMSPANHVKKVADDRFEPCGCADPGAHVEGPATGDYYLICLAYAESRCGQEDVYGHLCGDACATATDRPYIREGVTVRAIPLSVTEQLPDSRAVPFSRIHLRSRLASALFAQEVRLAAGSLISKAGLGEDAWCLGSALGGDDCVPLAVLARSGNTNVFLDAWSVRRERIEAPSRRYWAWRMRMRPWDVFLAQVLQFQCQLAGIAVAHPRPGELDDPCAPHIAVVDEAQGLLQEIRRYYTTSLAQRDPAVLTSEHPIALAGGLQRIDEVHDQLGKILKGVYQAPRDRVLIDGGIVELPSAGYLPVDNASAVSVNDQVRRLLGGGLDLRFCVVRPDFVAHALEEAQHMDRISLTYGLDHPDDRPKVDILVPDGSIAVADAPPGDAFDARIDVSISDVAWRKINQLARVVAPADTVHPSGIIERDAAVAEMASTVEIHENSGQPTIAERGPRTLIGGSPQPALELTLQGAAHGAIDPSRGVDFAFAVQSTPSALLSRFDPAAYEPAASEPSAVQPRIVGRRRLVRETALRGHDTGPIAAWAEIHCDRDLRTIGVGDHTDVSAQVSMTRGSSTVRGSLKGTFSVAQVGPGDGTRRELLGTFEGFVGVEQIGSGQITRSVRTPVAILIGPDAQGQPSLRVRMPAFPPLVALRLGQVYIDATWAGQILSVNVRVDVVTILPDVSAAARERAAVEAAAGMGPETVDATDAPAMMEIGRGSDLGISNADGSGFSEPVAGGRFRRDPHVLEASDPAHIAAMSAIHTIGIGLNQPSFEQRARDTLFPPLPAAPADVVVRATRDWVLFHRRRDKDCGPTMVEARPHQRYMVYAVPGGIPTHIPTPFAVGQVEFDAESASLLSSPESLATSWSTSIGLSPVIGGGIQSTGGPADAAVLLDRLSAVERAVDDTARLHLIPNVVAATAAELSPTMPLSPQGTDGVMLLAFGRAPERPLLRVSRVSVLQVTGPETVGQPKATLKPPSREILFEGLANAIDVTFADGAELAPESVRLDESFLIEGPNGTDGSIHHLGPNHIRFYSIDGFGDGAHTLTLKGDGDLFIAAKDGSRLDGDYDGDKPTLPSGDQHPGGDFVIDITRHP